MNTETILAILQQGEYDLFYFKQWWERNRNKEIKIVPEKNTFKIRILRIILNNTKFLPLNKRISFSIKVVTPLETIIRNTIIFVAKTKLKIYKVLGLKVVAIAGSYGKTSTKEIMKNLLSQEFKLLATSNSINTPLGISQIILKNLKLEHQLFIVEFGEYYKGDILALAKLTFPDFGIVTAIGRQHLERMGSLEKIAEVMGELIKYLKIKERILLYEKNLKYYSKGLTSYGSSSNATFRILDTEVSRRGTDFKMRINDETISDLFVPLYGEHQTVNILPSIWLLLNLKKDLKNVIPKISNLPYIKRRHEPIFAENNVLVLDNSYNTNPDSIKSSLKLINLVGGSNRIIITLGFVELGDDDEKVHEELGMLLAKSVDYVGLVESYRVKTIKKGFLSGGGKIEQIICGESYESLLTKMRTYIIPNSIILLEGGYKEVDI